MSIEAKPFMTMLFPQLWKGLRKIPSCDDGRSRFKCCNEKEIPSVYLDQKRDLLVIKTDFEKQVEYENSSHTTQN